jgi:hypothetical protein
MGCAGIRMPVRALHFVDAVLKAKPVAKHFCRGAILQTRAALGVNLGERRASVTSHKISSLSVI